MKLIDENRRVGKITDLLSPAAMKNFIAYQSRQEEFGEDSPDSLNGWISRLILEHQRQFPASWQGTADNSAMIARIANSALRNREFFVARAIALYA